MFEFLSDIADIAKVGYGAYSLLKDEPEGYDQLRASADRASQLASYLDPSSPGFKRLVADEESTLRTQFATDLKDLIRANRRATARTGMGILNPERRDEAIASALATHRATVRDKARQNVRNYLLQATGAQRGVAASYQPIMAASEQQQRNRASGFDALFSGISELPKTLENLSGLLNGDPEQYKPQIYDTGALKT